LTQKGASVALVDGRHAALQYDIDRTLHELIDIFGEQKAVRAYELSLDALLNLEEIAKKLSIENNFERRSCVYFAEYEKDVSFLEKEFKTREKYGYAVKLWDREKSKNAFRKS